MHRPMEHLRLDRPAIPVEEPSGTKACSGAHRAPAGVETWYVSPLREAKRQRERAIRRAKLTIAACTTAAIAILVGVVLSVAPFVGTDSSSSPTGSTATGTSASSHDLAPRSEADLLSS